MRSVDESRLRGHDNFDTAVHLPPANVERSQAQKELILEPYFHPIPSKSIHDFTPSMYFPRPLPPMTTVVSESWETLRRNPEVDFVEVKGEAIFCSMIHRSPEENQSRASQWRVRIISGNIDSAR